MWEAFLSLREEKQKKIINAAMKEFVKKGYRDASTNEIVSHADISKGSLFHYFGSKKGLAEFLIQHSMEVFAEKILSNMEDMSDDIIQRWRDLTLLKLALISEYPLIFEFVMGILKEDHEELQNYLKVLQQQFVGTFKQKLSVGIDYSRFKKGVDIERALKLIYWGLEGYAREVQVQRGKGPITEELLQETLRESSLYLDLYQKAFYQQREDFQ